MKEDEISSNQYKDFRRISGLLGYRSSCKILKLAHLSLPFLCLMSNRRKMNKNKEFMALCQDTLFDNRNSHILRYPSGTTAWGRNQNCLWSERGWCMATSRFATLEMEAYGVDKDLIAFFWPPDHLIVPSSTGHFRMEQTLYSKGAQISITSSFCYISISFFSLYYVIPCLSSFWYSGKCIQGSYEHLAIVAPV